MMHRRAHILGATAMVAVVAACGNHPARPQDATAEPVGRTSPSAAPAGSAGDASAAGPAPAARPSASPASPAVKAAQVEPAHLTVHPDHIGPLKIGMSLAAAKATGLIVVNAGQAANSPDSCVSAHWKGQPDHVWMVFNGRYGLRALDSVSGQKTPEGIKHGSSLAAVRRAYPHLTWRTDGDETPDAERTGGDALVDAVKGDGAHYRIDIQHGKVTDVQLESDRPGCYE
jgi:hypothetical protein